MNCQPRDLARIINHSETRTKGLVDKVVRVTRLAPSRGYGSRWEFEGPPLQCRCSAACRELLDCIPDEFLRPIRDPGDDAIDETLLRLPAPSTHRETEAA